MKLAAELFNFFLFFSVFSWPWLADILCGSMEKLWVRGAEWFLPNWAWTFVRKPCKRSKGENRGKPVVHTESCFFPIRGNVSIENVPSEIDKYKLLFSWPIQMSQIIMEIRVHSGATGSPQLMIALAYSIATPCTIPAYMHTGTKRPQGWLLLPKL